MYEGPLCRLCGQGRELCASHIIPEFLYKPLYDEKHRFYQISNCLSKTHEYLQKGLREHLLCRKCEEHFGKYEDYASKFFQGGTELKVTPFPDGLAVEGLEYEKFKLFQMSVLWRMGVSSRPQFRKVELGEKHESQLRQMLLEGNPGKPTEYGVLCFLIYEDAQLLNELIIPPYPYRFKGFRMYHLVCGGLDWGFLVSAHSKGFVAAGDLLNESGRIFLYKTQREELTFISDMARQLLPSLKSVAANAENGAA